MGLQCDLLKSSMYIDIDTVKNDWLPERSRMHKVSLYLQVKKNEEPSVYEPISVSLGPYHHGKEEFRRVEQFKKLCLHWCANEDNARKDYLYNLVFERVDEIRDCYSDISVLSRYDDEALALMMLLDACFIINFMRTRVSDETAKHSYHCLGVAAALPLAARDIMVLENQIPFFVLKLLIPQVPLEWEAETSLLRGFFTVVLSVSEDYAVIPREIEAPPLHLLEACWRVLVEKHSVTKQSNEELIKVSPSRSWPLYSAVKKKIANYSGSSKEYASDYITCPSAAYLKTMGINFKLSSSHSLKDVKFTSYALKGVLELPACYVSNMAFAYLANMIAYEIAPNDGNNSPDLTMLSYACFLKLLIQTPADVIELQDKGILRLNRFANHEQVVKLFRNIETFHLRDKHMYQDVMHRVGIHCNNKAKTWMADLVHCNLKNPWTITALFSASLILILTLLQTFYTIHQAYP